MLIKKIALLLVLGAVLLPLGVSAQTGIEEFLDQTVVPLLNYLIGFIIGLAVFLFIFNLLKFVTAKDEEKRNEAKMAIIVGLIVIAVMLSVWGLINLLTEGLDLDDSVPNVPQIDVGV